MHQLPLYQGVKDEQALLLEQRWASGEDLQRHLRSQRFHTILLVVEMACESRGPFRHRIAFARDRRDRASEAVGENTFDLEPPC